MEPISGVSYRMVLMVTCLVCLGFSVGMCSDALIKTVVSNDDLVYSTKLKLVPTISGSDWDSLVMQSKVPVMILFRADGCITCRAIDVVLDQMSLEYADNVFKFYRIDINKESDIANRYAVQSTPTTLVFIQGDEWARVPGVDTDRLWEIVREFA
ncbi:unnamed protein product [Microthlaspi erraticum]|uniref:Thioredoxin domain-containing protein n=1 Tax=Microthlaspi erraticum TaxID=1685480 RepID=A0A6D2HHJ4_9BRAS|nr:unnamed protein product [Microthlaspi erraticum]